MKNDSQNLRNPHSFWTRLSRGRCFALVVIIAVVLCPYAVQAQKLDSLMSAFNQSTDSILKKNISIQIARQYQAANAYGKAIGFYQKARSLQPDTADLSLLRGMAYCYRELGEKDQEIRIYTDILDLAVHAKDTVRMVDTMQTLSALMEKNGNYEGAIQWNKEILDIAGRRNNSLWACIALNNLGYLFNVLNDEVSSVEHFNRSYEIAKRTDAGLSDDHRAVILLNLGIANTRLARYKEARQYLNEVYAIRERGQDDLKKAEALNYLASFDIVQGDMGKAETKVKRAIDYARRQEPSEDSENVLLQCYKLLAQIALRTNNAKEYRSHVEQTQTLQQQIIDRDKRSIRLLLEQQVEVERKENEYRLLLAEQKMNVYKLRQSELERERNDRELELRQRELTVLKKEHELQLSRYYNQQLEKQKVSQQLQLVQEKATVKEQEQSISLLKKEAELRNLTLAQRKKAIDALEVEKKQSAQIRLYGVVIIILLISILLASIAGYWYREKRSRLLKEQYETIRTLNEEARSQNEELVSMNEQLALNSNALAELNTELNDAQQLVKDQNKQLKLYTENLEGKVDHQTNELIRKNLELLHYTSQLEQFTYAVSHNIRGPIARLQGLVNVINITPDVNHDAILEMIRKSAVDLDRVVNDLHTVLSIKSGNEPFEEVDIEHVVEKVLSETKSKIVSEVVVQTDFQQRHFFGIPSYFYNVVKNLVENAIKYRSSDRSCVISIKSAQVNDVKELSIQDNGIGIDLERNGSKLFGFYKPLDNTPSGRGLGLYMVKTQIEAMHGKISVVSEPDKGTLF